MVDGSEINSPNDNTVKDYEPEDSSTANDVANNNSNNNNKQGNPGPVKFTFTRNLTKIDSKIPQASLVVEKSKIGDMNIEPGSFSFA